MPIRLACLVLLGAIAYRGLLFWDPRSHAHAPLVGWLFEASETTPQLVYAIAAALLVRRRRQLRAALGGEPAPGWGALCLVPGAALHVWAQVVGAPDLMLVSLGLVTLGAAFLLAGRGLARELAAPLGVLAFAIPLPGVLHNHVVYPFQLATAHVAENVLGALGQAVVRQGDTLSMGARDFEVIETCSGLRGTQTLTLLAYTWAVFFGCTFRHAALLVGAAPAIAFVTNAIRVMILVLDPEAEAQDSHIAQGIVTFVVGAVGIFLVDQVLLRFGAARAVRPEDAAPPARVPVRARLGTAAVALVLAGLAAASFLPAAAAPAPPPEPPPALPRELAGWRIREGPALSHFVGTVRYAQSSSLSYARRGQSVSAFLGWDDRQLRSRSLLSEKNALPGLGWETEDRRAIELEPGAVRADGVVVRRFGSRELAFHVYHGAGGVLEETLRAALALDQPGSPWARRGGVWLLRLSTHIPAGPEGPREAEERLRSLFAELAPALGG